jgi:beta-fructofuranosidase
MTTRKANDYIDKHKTIVNPQFRLAFHGMPPVGWMNDPNGLVFYQGRYHVFFQHYPYDSIWGSMHWGHLVSDDLITFEHLPVALAPDQEDETGCFSGCALVDPLDNQRLHLFYTRHFEQQGRIIQTQAMATSTDGVRFIKRDDPIIPSAMVEDYAKTSDVRDPAIYRDNGTHYLIVGAQGHDGMGKFLVFSTDNLDTFTFHHEWKAPGLFGQMAECPAVVRLGDRHLLVYSKIDDDLPYDHIRNSSNYIIGDFDFPSGTHHHLATGTIDSGHHLYAPQLLTDDKGRTILIGWMEMWGSKMVTHELGHHWYGALTLPRVVTIRDDILYQWPIEELENYRSEAAPLQDGMRVDKALDIELDDTSDPFTLSFAHPDTPSCAYSIHFDGQHLVVDGTALALNPLDLRRSQHTYESVSLRIVVDTSSIEVFVNHGRETFTSRVYIQSATYRIHVTPGVTGTLHRLRSKEASQ